MTNTMKTSKCGKCGGKGSILAFSGTANGVCFQCNGTGSIQYASRVGTWTREKVIRMIQSWFTSKAAVQGWGEDAPAAIADIICRAPADVYARALAAAPKHLPAECAQEVARLCGAWRASFERNGEALA